MDVEKRINELDQLLRQGQAADARGAIERLARAKVARRYLHRIAWLAWRSGIPWVGLRVLAPLVKAPNSYLLSENASFSEKAEYAACLSQVGAAEVALRILDELSDEGAPKIVLYRVLTHASLWNYRENARILPLFLKRRDATSYQKLIARVNLAAAYVFERRHVEAEALCSSLLHDTSARRLDLLYGNSLELTAANFLLRGRLAEARRFVTAAKQVLARSANMYTLLAEKWEGLIGFLERGGADDGLAYIERVREMARQRKHWETLRDCDLFEARSTGAMEPALRLYFGTPYPAFRELLIQELPQLAKLPESYEWRLGAAGPATALDLRSVAEEPEGLRTGSAHFRLLRGLASDLYRPLPFGYIYALVFPGEVLNPETSPLRLRLATFRLGRWLKAAGFPLKVVSKDGFLRLAHGGAPCLLRLPLPKAGQALSGIHDSRLEALRARAGDGWFTSQEAAEWLGMSPRNTRRLIEVGVKGNVLLRRGVRKAARYRFEATGTDTEVVTRAQHRASG